MVSASVSVAGAAQRTADLTPIHARQADIQQNRVEALLGGDVESAAAGLRLPVVEGFNQPELLGQGLAQRLVVVDQKQAAVRGRPIHCRGGHRLISLFTRESASARSVRAAACTR